MGINYCKMIVTYKWCTSINAFGSILMTYAPVHSFARQVTYKSKASDIQSFRYYPA
ncbi:hypothetical protein PanWU01x14_127220 [Parasponia andersonii]|uniref:Uncharacterized protein n=1 Tax=Parasponia andersonii TaxID=3476 RepID=A0A2P5CSD1_PARAD|nr:hypothetical protein PanWU01x14_127220 [Parasponia andersonii]